MVVTVTLARGALRLARRGVIAKRLAAIHDLGAMNTLCTDKTGTLTEAKIRLVRHVDGEGLDCPKVLRLAYLNSAFDRNPQSARRRNPRAPETRHRRMDQARRGALRLRAPPYLGVARDASDRGASAHRQGAPEDVLKHSTHLQSAAGDVAPLSEATRARTSDVFSKLGEEGYRALGIAFRRVGAE